MKSKKNLYLKDWMRRLVNIVILLVFTLFWACEKVTKNPIGSDFIGRNSGSAFELPRVPLSKGNPRFEGIIPQSLGEGEELLLGRMNGFVYRSLLRFEVDLDSMGIEENSIDELKIESLSLSLSVRSSQNKGKNDISIGKPGIPWDELSTFVDTLSGIETEVHFVPIQGALAVLKGDSVLMVDLPESFIKSALVSGPSNVEIELILLPDESSDFILELISGDALDLLESENRPKVEIHYSMEGKELRYVTEIKEDTYWGERFRGGPNLDQLFLSTGIVYSSILHFKLPNSIPIGSTINSVKLELDVNDEYSFFDVFSFRIDQITIDPLTGDSTFVVIENRQLKQGGSNFDLSLSFRPIVQNWLSKRYSNHGLVLRPVQTYSKMEWVALRNANLRLIYSTPPNF